MTIHWYPGHMHKARKEMAERLPQVDLLIEILDARIPWSSENPAIAGLRGDKPCIKVLSKSDLADPDVTVLWQAHLEQQRGVKTLPTRTDQPAGIKMLAELCRSMLPQRDSTKKPIQAMVVGIPNVGKSSLINILAGRVIAKTGNEPAVTKSQQRISLGNGITLFDTPGILWPKVDNPASSYRLAATGAIRDTAMSYGDVGDFAAEFLIRHYPGLLKERFKLDSIPATANEFLELAAAKRGAVGAGGHVDLHRISELLIKELRSGKIGRISLETPAIIEQEQLAMAHLAAEHAADKAERKRRFKEGSMTLAKQELKELRGERTKPGGR